MTDDLTEAELDEILDDAELPEITIPLCVRSNLQAEFEAADQRLTAALDAMKDTDSLGGAEGDLEALAAEVEEIRQRMLKRTIRVRFRARDPQRWSQLIASHPPREDNDRDMRLGLNVESFFTALVKESTIAPSSMTGARWDKLLKKLTDGQWDLLTETLWRLNREAEASVPFSPAASRILRTSAAASKQRQPSDSL